MFFGVTDPKPPEPELKRDCTGRTCKGVMHGAKIELTFGKQHQVQHVKWTCKTCGKVEI